MARLDLNPTTGLGSAEQRGSYDRMMGHTLVLYRSSRRADAALQGLAGAARERGGRLTVLSLALQESESRCCCDRRSVLWNQICRELAAEDLARAALAIDGAQAVDLDTLGCTGRHVADALAREALDRGVDEIFLADARGSGLGALERRRLRRRSPVPVSK
jgi:hypothetical protein